MADNLTVSACVVRLSKPFGIPAGIDMGAWAKEMGMFLSEFSNELAEELTTLAVRKSRKLPMVGDVDALNEKRLKTVAEQKKLADAEADRLHRLNRTYDPPKLIPVVKDTQTREELTEFLNATLKKYGFGPVGSVLRRM